MNRTAFFVVLCASLMLPPMRAIAQGEGEVSLGDLARSLRKSKAPPPQQSIIDNDNFAKAMKEAEEQRLKNKAVAAPAVPVNVSDPVEEVSRKFKVTSTDGSCNLSFSANLSSQANAAFASQDLPEEEISKLDGPARIEGGELHVSVHNGSAWDIKEITVGLTLVRAAGNNGAQYGGARLITAAQETVTQQDKPADVTLLYHLRGDAVPLATAHFHGPLSGTVEPDQEWHWAILQAKGIPPEKETVPSPVVAAD
ncbi:MAG: hypothetical protein M3O09_13195 [Acidobacteriota bacterium]|nr:hypothetical protein [Acidobacteriota bacterium]